MGSRKGKYVPRHMMPKDQRDRERAKDRVQYAKRQLAAGLQYNPYKDPSDAVDYNMPSAAFDRFVERYQVPTVEQMTPQQEEEAKQAIRQAAEGSINKKKTPRVEDAIQLNTSKEYWDKLLKELPDPVEEKKNG